MKQYIVIILSIIWTAFLHAQTDTNYLNGRITGKKFSPGSKIDFLIFNPNHINVSLKPDTVLTTTIDSTGNFNLKYIPPQPLFYMGMDFYNGTDSLLSSLRKEFLIDPFICQSGDSVSLSLKIISTQNNGGGLSNIGWFSGKGADKYNVQYLINHYEEASELSGPYYYYGALSKDEPIFNKEKFYLLQQEYRLHIADAFKGHVPDTILTRIKRNLIAMSKYRFTSTFLHGRYSWGIKEHKQKIIDFVNAAHSSKSLFSRDDELTGSRGYADFILLADELRYRIKHNISYTGEVKYLHNSDFASWMYNNIKTNYSGSLREILLTEWFSNGYMLKYFFKKMEPFLQEAKAMLKLEDNRTLLDKIAEQSEGKKAFPFKFIDEKGKIHTLEDYKDKIYVLDFWYTGCLGCTGIPPVMKIIMEEFKSRKDVVFLSISVDRSIKWWEYGLSTGLYTLPGQIHLKTIDRGKNDPFILNYQIGGYPKVMVIGKNGELLAVNPTDPRIDKGKDIIDMIKMALKN
ncbi:thioredoxin family protein [Sphingobacterium sp. PCS056]|uniref:TlpA family protein disulfide reductase n=1 Tax=Sphingobacterium sp. PCS056 TaxID=2931400 RepID=UPI00200FC502|nr:thioredoxin family protein [Sphingobacterium sp. PCS056]UPZ37988.1 thioredoxin family protein [Sphingobacterium sp. PCS056]